MDKKISVIIYTDGACKGNPGPGGWGAVLMHKEKVRKIYGGEHNTTNNRMELLGAIQALSLLRRACNVKIFTDSKYVKNGIQSWMEKWKQNDWKTSAKKPVKNVDLWKRLDELCGKHTVKWLWVKGHSGDKYNDMADELANKGVATLL